MAKKTYSFKPRFRPTLLSILLGLIFLSVALVGVTSYYHARETAEQLAGQILQQTSQRIEERVLVLLRYAARQGELADHLMQDKIISARSEPTAAEFPSITAYFYEVMRVNRQLSFLSLGLEASGEYCHVERRAGGKLVIQECLRDEGGRIERSDFEVRDDGTRVRTRFDADWHYDPRTRPYYQACRAAGKQIWTETYVFRNDPSPDMPGVTCATPLQKPSGELVGVISSDFNLEAICGFLQTMQIGRESFATVIEILGDNQLRVIAHPNPELLIKNNGHEHILVPANELPDSRLRALVARVREQKGKEQLRVDFHDGTRNYLAECRQLRGEDMPHWLVCTVIPESEIMAGVWRSNKILFLIGLATLALGAFASAGISAQVARPLEHLAREAEAVGRLELDSKSIIESRVREVDQLAVASEEMKIGLRSFRKYVPADLVRSLIGSGQEARLGAERRVVTVAFTDIVGFTTIAESLDPEKLTELLGEYLALLSDHIHDTAGTIDKYTGDGVMALWGAPQSNPQHAFAACCAAVRSRTALRRLEDRLHFRTRYGIHTGEAAVGNFGSPTRLNYTVIGDTVNLASRLEGLNKYYGTEIMISESTFLSARNKIVARPLDWVAVKGKTGGTLIYELLGLKGEIVPVESEFLEALECYGRQEWGRAIALLEQFQSVNPQDKPAGILYARCRQYQTSPPDPNWDRVHRFEKK